MRRCVAVFLAMVIGLFATELAFAAKKPVKAAKSSKPAVVKPIYEAPMTVVIVRAWSQTCEPTCPEWISAEGEITGATPAAFNRVFKAMGKKKLPIVIRSPGGSITAALDIGRMIRKRGLDVAVGTTIFQGCAPDSKTCKLPVAQNGIYHASTSDYGGFCYSACPLILAGGKSRYASYGTQVGVHQPKTIWTQQRYTYREYYRIIKGKKKVISRKIINRLPTSTKVTFGYDKRLRAKLSSFYWEMGVDVAILEDSNKASFQGMYQLQGQRVQDLRLRTSPRSVGVLTMPTICKAKVIPENCITDKNGSLSKIQQPAQLNGDVLPIGIVSGDREMVLVVVRNHNVACEPACPAWIAADGVIASKTPAAFQALNDRLGATRLPVVFNSPGGDVDAAMALGRIIRAQHSRTVIAKTLTASCDLRNKDCAVGLPGGTHGGMLALGRCHGACLAAFAGGERRANAYDSEVLVHAPGADDGPGQVPTTAVKYFTHFSNLGVGKALMQDVNAAVGTHQSPVPAATLSAAFLVNEKDFKLIVAVPSGCAARHESILCFKSETLRLRP